MKKTLYILWFILLIFGLSPKMDAMPAPYVDAFIDYESFLAGVDYYLGDNYHFESTEIQLHEDYYVSYQITHFAYNRKTFNQGGTPLFIFQSKDNNDFYFELYLNMKPGPEIMTVQPSMSNVQSVMMGEFNSWVEISVLNDKVIPENEINRIFTLISTLYGKTMVIST